MLALERFVFFSPHPNHRGTSFLAAAPPGHCCLLFVRGHRRKKALFDPHSRPGVTRQPLFTQAVDSFGCRYLDPSPPAPHPKSKPAASRASDSTTQTFRCSPGPPSSSSWRCGWASNITLLFAVLSDESETRKHLMRFFPGSIFKLN